MNSRDLVRLLKKMVVCRRRCAASLADPDMELRTLFLGRPRTKKCVRPFVCATPSTTKPGPLACARVIGGFTYEVTFVRLLARGDPTCTHELVGLKVDVSGEFIAEFELVFVQEP